LNTWNAWRGKTPNQKVRTLAKEQKRKERENREKQKQSVVQCSISAGRGRKGGGNQFFRGHGDMVRILAKISA
jgi:hypothetical protein